MTRKDKPSYSIYSINNANRKMVICIEHWGSFVFTQCNFTSQNRLKTQSKKRQKTLRRIKNFQDQNLFFFFFFFFFFFVNLHESKHLPDLLPCFTKDRRTYKRGITPSKIFLWWTSVLGCLRIKWKFAYIS